jgi:hypothetical protein
MKHIRCRKAAVLMMGIAGVGLAQAQEAPIGAAGLEQPRSHHRQADDAGRT